MSDIWIRVVVLVCTFGAVALLVETLVSWVAHSHTVSHAMNERMRMPSRSAGSTRPGR